MEAPLAVLRSAQVAHLRPRAAARGHVVATLGLLACLPLFMRGLLREGVDQVANFVTAGACVALAGGVGRAAFRWRKPVPMEGEIAARTTTIDLRVGDRTRSVARRDVERAVTVQGEAGAVFELHLANGDVMRAVVASVDEGQRFVRDAGLPAVPSVETFRFATWTHQALQFVARWFGGVLGLCLTWSLAATAVGDRWSHLLSDALFTLFLLFTPLLAWVTFPRSLEVGAEGVTVRVLLSRSFIPYDALARARVEGSADAPRLVIESRGRGDRRLRAAPPFEDAPGRAVAAIEARVRTWRARAVAGRVALARGGRSVAAWRERLLGELGGGAVFRDASLGRDALLGVVESPAAPPSQRLGAALALAGAGDEVRTHVRVAADACADDALRDALRATLDGTLDEAAAVRVERAEAERAKP